MVVKQRVRLANADMSGLQGGFHETNNENQRELGHQQKAQVGKQVLEGRLFDKPRASSGVVEAAVVREEEELDMKE